MKTSMPDFNPAAIPADQIPAALAQIAAWQTQLAARLMQSPLHVHINAEAISFADFKEALKNAGLGNPRLRKRPRGDS